MIKMLRVGKLFLKPYIKGNKVKLLITLIGISLGVGVFVAVEGASNSVRQSMQNLLNVISSGTVDIEVVRGRGGFSEEVYKDIYEMEGIKEAHPVLLNKTKAKLGTLEKTLYVFGIDVTRRGIVNIEGVSNVGLGAEGERGGVRGEGGKDEGSSDYNFDLELFLTKPGSVIVGRGFVNRYKGVKSFKLVTAHGVIECEIVGILSGEDSISQRSNIVLMDLYASQYLFKREGRLDRVDIKVMEVADRDVVINKLKGILKGGFSINEKGHSVRQFGNLYKSFDLNLKVVSFISLLVGIYLIMNTIGSSITQKKREIGIIRSIGGSRGDIVRIFTLKGLVIGLVGSAFGILLGYILSYVAVEAFRYNIMYKSLLEGSEFKLSYMILLKGFIFGFLSTMVATFIPILISFRKMPNYSIRPYANIQANRSSLNVRLLYILGLIIFVLGFILALMGMYVGDALYGFLSNFLIIVGFTSILPYITEHIIKWSDMALKRLLIKRRDSFELKLGISNTGGISLGKSVLAMSTLMISIGLIVNISILVESYHKTLEDWFVNVNNADISIVSGSTYSEGDIFAMESNRLGELSNLKEKYIEDIDYYRFMLSSYKGEVVELHSFRLDIMQKRVRYRYEGGTAQEAYKLMEEGDGVLISSKLANRFNLALGDELYLSGDRGSLDIGPFKVAGIVINYPSSKGIVSIPRKTYIKHFKDDKVDIFKVYLKEGVTSQNFKQAFYKGVKEPDTLIVTTLKEFKEEIFKAIDETFYMFNVLSVITVFIAIIGLINALLSSVVDRRREIGILKALGALKGQIVKIIVTQSTFIGFISALLGLVSGILLSLVTVNIINKHTVGWHLDYTISPEILYILLLFPILSILSGYYPALKASEIVPRVALEYE